MIKLTKELNITEEELDNLFEELKDWDTPEFRKLMDYVDKIDIPSKGPIKEDMYYSLWNALENCDLREQDENLDEYCDLPISIEWIDYAQDACCYRITYQSGNMYDDIQ